eukprot:CAMPEP_0170550902 /NCGR_PEP_ID=MMETSP0211-20121228/8912_1 /TAXON_ID=311385 /ORGANISM="Pseudokeronopsis sp., Strain OXSARD2" /LENGTH=390 /DNA_ID=CAMNT_0010857721 /DNA_START=52 /DNA_END=1224 /DNA_ORIENTATION=-
MADADQVLPFYLQVIIHIILLLEGLGVVLGVEGGLKGVAVEDLELLEHHQPRRGVLFLLIGELTVIERKKLILLAHHIGNDLDEVVVFVLVHVRLTAEAAVHEYIPFPAMPMHITEDQNLMVYVHLSGEELGVVDCGVEELGGVDPAPVQVHSQDIASVVSLGHSVRIQHRNYLEDEGLSEELSLSVVLLEQEVDDPLHHKGRVALSRMHPTGQKDHLLVHILFCDFVSDGEDVAGVHGDGVAEFLDLEVVLHEVLLELLFDHKDVILQVTERVWLEVGEEDNVIVVFEAVGEAEGVQVERLGLLIIVHVVRDVLLIILIVRSRFTVLGFELVFVVLNILAAPLPLVGLVLFVLLHRVDKRLHPLRVGTVILVQIHYIELKREPFFDVPH